MISFRLRFDQSSPYCAVICLILSSATATGCSHAERIITVEQVDKIVSSHVHVGSSKEEVLGFVDSLRIDSLRIIRGERFWDAEFIYDFDTQRTDRLGDRLKQFYGAVIEDVAPSTETFQVNIMMRFYFDEDGKLLDYSIKEDIGFR